MKFTSTRVRLFLMVLLVALPSLGVQFLGAWSDLQKDLDYHKNDVSLLAAHAGGDFAILKTKAQTVFSDLVRVNEMRSPDNCTQVYNALRFAYERLAPEVVNLALADARGSIYCAVNPVQGESNLSSQPYFQAALKTLDAATGEYSRNPVTGTVSVAVAYPALSFDGEVQTVIVAMFGVHWLETWQAEVSLPRGAGLSLLTPSGEVLQSWRDSRDVDTPPIEDAAIRQASLAGAAGVVESAGPDGIRSLNTILALGGSSQPAGYLHLSYPVEGIYTQVYQSLGWRLVLLGIIFILAMLAAWWGSEHMFLRPLEQLMSAVQKVQAGDLNVRASKARSNRELTEVTHLAAAFDRMTISLQERERERQKSEARFHAAFESSAVGVGLLSLDGRILAANPAVCEMSGYSEEELKQRYDSQNVYPADNQVGADLFAEMLAGKRDHYSVEKRYVRKNGEVFWTRLTLSSVCDAAGQPDYLVGMIEDIDRQKRATENLRESEARFRSMFENAAVGVAVMTLDRHIIQINQTAARITGYSAEEISHINPSILAVEEDRALDQELFKELLAGGRDQYTIEKRYIRKDGTVFWGRVNFSAVSGLDGKPLYTIGLIEDITQEKEAQKLVADSEARFRTLYNHAEIGIVLVDLSKDGSQPLNDTRFNQLVAGQRLNPAMQRMFGYTEDELLHTDILDLIYKEDHGTDTQSFRQLMEGKIDGFRSEKRFVRKDGSIFWGRLSDSLVRAADGTPRMVIGIIEDITEEREAKERLVAQEAEYRRTLEQRIAERTLELNAANERLREKAAQDAVAAERTRLARDLHDAVTQTLFSTTLIADVLPEIWAMNPAEGKRRLEEVRQLNRGALAEMRTLLVELRPNALIEVPLPALLRQLTEAMIGRSRMEIQFNSDSETWRGFKLPPEVQVGLYRVAQEALNNVVKHAKASQAVLTLHCGETVRLTVADNGQGFDPASVTGDHLGLKIMRERAEAIGARFSVYSEPGEGTQVSVVWKSQKTGIGEQVTGSPLSA